MSDRDIEFDRKLVAEQIAATKERQRLRFARVITRMQAAAARFTATSGDPRQELDNLEHEARTLISVVEETRCELRVAS